MESLKKINYHFVWSVVTRKKMKENIWPESEAINPGNFYSSACCLQLIDPDHTDHACAHDSIQFSDSNQTLVSLAID